MLHQRHDDAHQIVHMYPCWETANPSLGAGGTGHTGQTGESDKMGLYLQPHSNSLPMTMSTHTF